MAVKIQTIKDIRIYLKKELNDIYNEPEIRVLSDILIKTITGISKLHQLYDNGYPITGNEANKITKFTSELKSGRPVQHVIGETTFYNCTIKVNEATLIPRPETEELVDRIIMQNKDYDGNIIDFGTGSGCIAIALAGNLKQSNVTGTDISEEAVRIANQNSILNNVRVNYLIDDIFNPHFEKLPTAGIIVSNPPYIRNSEKLHMHKNVLSFEPHLALFVDDSEPLVFYDAILKLSEKLLLPGGRIYFEINEAMGSPLATLIESFSYSEIIITSDINDKQRIIEARKKV
ncbi:MAG TPA: peptide chain release factor N(5)-glutamine methyltransferase [Bacteroidales bacterium]|nr:peptide chain release factor N(5)-glutamine methyltransferase [Bacteroidales bacterium]